MDDELSVDDDELDELELEEEDDDESLDDDELEKSLDEESLSYVVSLVSPSWCLSKRPRRYKRRCLRFLGHSPDNPDV